MALDVNDADFVVQRVGRQYKEKPPVFNDNLQVDELFAIQRGDTLYKELHYYDEWYNHIGDNSYVARYHIANIRSTFTLSDNSTYFDVYAVATESEIAAGVTTFQFEAGKEYIVLSYDVTPSGSRKELLKFNTACNFDFGVATNTRRVKSFSNFFAGNSTFDGDIQYLVVSENCTGTVRMFQNASAFSGHNFDKTHWNTSNVVIMDYMFENCYMFGADLTDWCVTKITSDPFKFRDASKIIDEWIPCWGNCPKGEDGTINPCDRGWTKHLGPCFHVINTGTETINLTSAVDLTGYDPDTEANLGPVTSVAPGAEIIFTAPFDCSYLFANNHYAEWDFGVETDLKDCTDMSRMFEACYAFNGLMGGSWDTSQVVSMEGTFHKCNEFNQDLDDWDVTGVLNMHEMFAEAYFFDGDVSSWEVDNVTNMNRMFTDAQRFKSDISSWGTKECTDMEFMFRGTQAFNIDIGEWKTPGVIDMKHMFEDATAFNQDLAKWCVSDITTKPVNFDTGATSWTGGDSVRPLWGQQAPCDADKPWKNQGRVIWHIENATRVFRTAFPVDMWRASDGAPLGRTNLIPQDISVVFTTSEYSSGIFDSVATVNNTVDWDFGEETDVSLARTFNRMFYQCQQFKGKKMGGNWDVSNVTDFDNCFHSDAVFANPSIQDWNTKNATKMYRMFYRAYDIKDFDFSQWCVPKCDARGGDEFAKYTDLPADKEPRWLSCPRGEDQLP
jgi:hypothetical protein